jgi:tryptophan 2,3-dioxygenase
MAKPVKITPEIQSRLNQLAEKYRSSGQELLNFLDGLLYQDYNTYWDYIHLDTLLSLQNPITSIPDEEIFIMYHQITELYFKLALHEIKQLAFEEAAASAEQFKIKVQRINRYFSALTHSFGVMEKGMDRQQFLNFRMSLIPASGFQSVQYRMVEIGATDFINLVDKDERDRFKKKPASLEEMYRYIYWKKGATLEQSGQKTLTLKQFELKYTASLLRFAKRYQANNLWQRFKSLSAEEPLLKEIRQELRKLDLNVNVNWPLQHYRTSVAYLAQRPSDIASTGGTNWQKYLPPRFQKRIFYPQLWSTQEIDEWGKSWVQEVLDEAGLSKKR